MRYNCNPAGQRRGAARATGISCIVILFQYWGLQSRPSAEGASASKLVSALLPADKSLYGQGSKCTYVSIKTRWINDDCTAYFGNPTQLQAGLLGTACSVALLAARL